MGALDSSLPVDKVGERRNYKGSSKWSNISKVYLNTIHATFEIILFHIIW